MNKVIINQDDFYIIPVGGCGEFGMNCTLYVHNGKVLIVDAGLSFAPEYEIGIDSHIVDIKSYIASLGEIIGYVITHGHEDHIGSLPFLLKNHPAPIYSGKWAMEILKNKLGVKKLPFEVNYFEEGKKLQIGPFEIQTITVPHSIPGCSSVAIRTEKANVFHTGDFKTQEYSSIEKPFDVDLLKEIGKSGFHCMLADSTNAHKEGKCPSEDEVYDSVVDVIQGAKGYTLFTTFASNFWRLHTVLRAAKAANKVVVPIGTGINKSFRYASACGIFNDKEFDIKQVNDLKTLDRKDVVLLVTGSQGEHKAALARIVKNEHPKVSLKANDRVVFSSRAIPGNEKTIAEVISICSKNDVEIITPRDNNIHVSGHAYKGDIELFLEHIKPRFHLPVHGTFTQLKSNQNISFDNSDTMENGAVWKVSDDGVEKVGYIDPKILFVDSWSRLPMDFHTMRRRQKIGDSGLAIVDGVYCSKKKQFISELHMETFGIPPLDKGEGWDTDLLRRTEKRFQKCLEDESFVLNRAAVEEFVRRQVRKYLTSKLIKKPVVISRVHLV